MSTIRGQGATSEVDWVTLDAADARMGPTVPDRIRSQPQTAPLDPAAARRACGQFTSAFSPRRP
ncbi:MAG TPA: hypothetical protein VMU49_06470 [Candidatus Acidoferrales bacterium]|nr:hypothetical protein [Candidatus Acidoferrales bacterium]